MDDPSFRQEDIASVQVDDLGAVVVVQLAGEIDMATSAVVGDPLFTCLDGTPRAVVIDLTRIQFMGSTGLHILTQAYQGALHNAITLRIVADTPAVLRPLEISGLGGYLPVNHSLPEALTSVATARNTGARQ